MLVYPQLITGALSQYPVVKRRRSRTVATAAGDGRSLKLTDPTGGSTEWQLTYSDLSDEEVGELEQFFLAAEGSLKTFTFVDPIGNLLARSGELDEAVWSKGPLLSLASGLADPQGRHEAWRLINAGAGPQGLTQSVAGPPEYLYSVSVYARSAGNMVVTLLAGPHRGERTVSAEWRRISFTDTGDAGMDPVMFGLELPAGAVVEVYGMQVEAQAGASGYQATTTGGVYEGARLRDDSLQLTASGVNRHSCTVNIIHANHL